MIDINVRNPNDVIKILLLALHEAEQFYVDKKTNNAQFTFGDDCVETDNKATVRNFDVNLTPSNNVYSFFSLL